MTKIVCMLMVISFVATTLTLSDAHAQVNRPQAVAGEYIVKMKSQQGVSANNRLRVGLKVVNQFGSAIKVKQAFWGSQMLHVKADEASIENLKANSEVEYVEPNYLLSVDPVDIQPFGVAASPTDTYDQSNSNVKVTEAWAIEKPAGTGSKTVVAVIDTGLDLNHGVFASSNAIWTNTRELNGVAGVDDDGNGYVDDIHGWNYVAGNGNMLDDDDHGTHVAGIILGVGQDILAYPVRESKIQILPLKFLDSTGSGSTANAVSAIYYAVNMGAKVINNSWGGSSYSRSLHEAYSYAYSHGVMIASAAGNSGTNNDSSPMYPASLDTPNNIAIAASTDTDNKASFSNYGSSVAVAAPGVAIVSTVPGSGCLSPGCYQMMSGTSMASPFVAGLAALIFREAPQLSGYQVRNIIIGSVDAVSGFSGKISTGGRVNAYKAITSALTQTATAYWLPEYSPTYLASRGVASDSGQTGASPAAAGCGLVKAVLKDGGDGPSAGSAESAVAVIIMVFTPLALAISLRGRTAAVVSGIQRRKFARYNLAKSMVVQIGDQVISADTETVSVGGISFSSALHAVKGEIVKLKIADLDQEVEGEIVWCSQQQSYGVRFLNVSEQLKDSVAMWTAGLTPT